MNDSNQNNLEDHSIQNDEFLLLFSQHSRRIFEFISTLVLDYSDAEDLFQSTCVVLWKKFESYDPSKSFYAWACRIAYLEMLHLRRSRSKLRALSEEVLSILAEDMLKRSDYLSSRQAVIGTCLEKLSQSDRDLIEQRYYHQKRPKEISSSRAGSVYSVYRALTRIHMALRRCVERSVAKERLA